MRRGRRPGTSQPSPADSSVRASNSTGSGVSVIATKRSPRRVRLTFGLSLIFGENIDITRENSERQGSVANSE